MKFLIRTYPNGEYFPVKDLYFVQNKFYAWGYYLIDDKVDNIVIGCPCMKEESKKEFEKLKHSLILKSHRLSNDKFYYNDELKEISFAWRFATFDELIEKREVSSQYQDYGLDPQIIYISFY